MRLAVDVMGGDHAPDAILKGCLDALPSLGPDDQLVLVGNRRDIQEILTERGATDPRLIVEHASEVIGMDESPVDAVRAKKDSSLVRMALLGSRKAEVPCDVVLSAGNTGACVSAATMHMKRLPGVHRPGIAVTIPSFKGPVVLCDAGANPEPRATHLWQYGIMSAVFSHQVLGIERPRVAQMNIGSEEGKGTDLIQQVHELCKATPGMNYIGFIEGRDLFDGAADVVITDGFVGNTLLKMAEGLAKSLIQNMIEHVFAADMDLALQLEPVMKSLYKRMDYHEYGGAPLLGVNGVCVIAHGSSQAKTIKSAIANCRQYVKSGFNDSIIQRLAEVEHIARHQHQAEPA
ncbi:MAG: phosphate acyltransferase PlsX [Phycisphaeraceae bacterium]|nr:phosphate acyltransferase PlsX [Phycisphaeraceae bacterium]